MNKMNTKYRGELGCSERLCSSCSTSGICRLTYVTNPMIFHTWRNDGMWLGQTEHIHGHM